MSLGILTDAVVRELRIVVGFRDEECDIQPMPGLPPADCGLHYCAVCPGSTRFLRNVGYFEETYDVTVVYSRRTSDCPKDRRGRLVWFKAVTGVEAMIRKVFVAIHGSEHLIYTTANGLFPALPAQNRFLELLAGPAVVPPPEPVGDDWFGGDPGNKDAGLIITMTFSGAKRLQSKESAV